ncbi:uncharacterized protein LOC115242208 [Formica exsecta]|uniref:uncharacterized protein LOC115242208 n=1 Tax=Formica exsecta TaxID=72781 RepID=UPI0011448301|nr:uncharacterized protein LOC115242208 [Formica exsecta]
MGLEVAPQKFEALFLYRGEHGAPPKTTHVVVDGTSVRVGTQLKYLGLYLDDTWSFDGRFARLAPRAKAMAHALSRLLPSLGGPDGRVRRLYATTVRAVALYGSPIWADALMASRRGKMMLRRIFRRIAIRVIRGYRTVSHAAASVLAGLPPIELYAQMYAEVYGRTKELGGLGVVLIPRVRAAVRLQAWRRMLE